MFSVAPARSIIPTPLDSYDVLLLDVFVVSVLGIPKIGIYRSDASMS